MPGMELITTIPGLLGNNAWSCLASQPTSKAGNVCVCDIDNTGANICLLIQEAVVIFDIVLLIPYSITDINSALICISLLQINLKLPSLPYTPVLLESTVDISIELDICLELQISEYTVLSFLFSLLLPYLQVI